MDEWKHLLIDEDVLVRDALKKIDLGGGRNLFVTNEDSSLVGALSDGDIRRYLLKNGSLDDPIRSIINRNPICIDASRDKDLAKRLMSKNRIEILPVIDDQRHIMGAIHWLDIVDSPSRNIARRADLPVVIMAGGRGERLSPLTKILPKPLVPLGDKPIIEVIIDQFMIAGVANFYIILNYKGDLVRTYLESINESANFEYIWEKDFLGTAGGLKLLPDDFPDNFVLSNCDIIVNADYGDALVHHKENQNFITVIGSVQHYKIPFGVIDYGENGKITKFQEKPELDFTINTGVYIINKEILKLIPNDGQYHMTDLIKEGMSRDMKIGVYPVSEKSFIDIGQLKSYNEVIENLRSGRLDLADRND
ncbi:MAG: NTP transferase domain-containing protein [Candidatus Lindowbacteria bacterium]|nr:NTP transferase domain-containing protein [Candidatus Lindowbacteria bacterium]